MEVPNFFIGQILSRIRRRMKLVAAGARDPSLAAVANHAALPADMLHDIMLRLPADDVCRMRLVCRSWRSVTSDPVFARAHALRHPQPYVVVIVVDSHDELVAEVRAMDLDGKVIKCSRIPRPFGPPSVDGDLLCTSHCWGLTCAFNMVTGAIENVVADHRNKAADLTSPQCVRGHVPAAGEYKVLRIQADYLSRRWKQTCEVMTLGGGGDAGRWRRGLCPPIALRIKPWLSSWNVAVVAGLAYFLTDEDNVEADRIAVFDLTTEEWKPVTLQGPLTNSLLVADSTNGEEDDEPIMHYFMPHERPLFLLRSYHFQLARLGESLVVLYCNVKKGSTELWFLEEMEDGMTACWSKRYTLQRTPFGDKYPLQYHYPLAVLDNGRILVWEDRTSTLKAYDPVTCTWTDLTMLTGGTVVGLHHGSLLCSNVGAVQP